MFDKVYVTLSFRQLSIYYSDFFFNDTATTEIYTLSLHDALPISNALASCAGSASTMRAMGQAAWASRSEKHTSELQSPCNLVCRLLLEKKKKKHERAVNLIPRVTKSTRNTKSTIAKVSIPVSVVIPFAALFLAYNSAHCFFFFY